MLKLKEAVDWWYKMLKEADDGFEDWLKSVGEVLAATDGDYPEK